MSGICGILDFNGKPSAGRLDAMLFMLSHRGTGEPAIRAEKNISLGFWDLKTLDESRRCPQPFTDKQSGVSIVFDGRLDNPNELLEKLGLSAAADAEIISQGYRRWGKNVFKQILGDFALALWDELEQELVLARDCAGVRPLYYFFAAERFIFASEAKAILALPGVPRKPDYKRLRELERSRFHLKDATFFEGILRAAPGEYVEVRKNGVTRTPFWEPDIHRKIVLPSSEAYQKQFRAVFFEAVRCRLPKTGTVAIALSGGLDSSSVACAASEIQRREKPDVKLETFSLISNRFPDERTFSALVAEANKLPNTMLNYDGIDLLESVPQMVFEQESPIVLSSDAFFRGLLRAAAGKGAKIVLNGEWGDQLMCSDAYLVDFLLEGRWRSFYKELEKFCRHENVSMSFMLKRMFLYAAAPRRSAPAFSKRAQRQLYEAVFHPVNTLMIESMERAAAYAGMELRMPFLDRRLVEFVLGIPADERVKDGIPKRLLRESDILPQAISGRGDKTDYTVCMLTRLKEAGFEGDDADAAEILWSGHMKRKWFKTWFEQTDYD